MQCGMAISFAPQALVNRSRNGDSLNYHHLNSNVHGFIIMVVCRCLCHGKKLSWSSLVNHFGGFAVKADRVGVLNEVQIMPLFNKYLDLQISSLMGSFKKINAFLVHLICSNETVHVKWCLHKSVRQTKNGLKRVSVKHWLNCV